MAQELMTFDDYLKGPALGTADLNTVKRLAFASAKLLQEGSLVFARTLSQETVVDWLNETKRNKQFWYLACLCFLGTGAQSEELGVRSAVQLVETEDSASKSALALLSLAFKVERTSKVETQTSIPATSASAGEYKSSSTTQYVLRTATVERLLRRTKWSGAQKKLVLKAYGFETYKDLLAFRMKYLCCEKSYAGVLHALYVKLKLTGNVDVDRALSQGVLKTEEERFIVVNGKQVPFSLLYGLARVDGEKECIALAKLQRRRKRATQKETKRRQERVEVAVLREDVGVRALGSLRLLSRGRRRK